APIAGVVREVRVKLPKRGCEVRRASNSPRPELRVPGIGIAVATDRAQFEANLPQVAECLEEVGPPSRMYGAVQSTCQPLVSGVPQARGSHGALHVVAAGSRAIPGCDSQILQTREPRSYVEPLRCAPLAHRARLDRSGDDGRTRLARVRAR